MSPQDLRTRRLIWIGFAVWILVAIVGAVIILSGCSVLRSAAPEPVAPLLSALQLDSLAQLPAYLVPPPAASTPRQRRQWQRAQAANLARAGIAPGKVKIKGSTVATGTGAVATTITKAKAPVATAPAATATDNTKAGQRGGSAAIGAGATASTERRTSWWWLLIPVGLLLLNRLVRGRWLL